MKFDGEEAFEDDGIRPLSEDEFWRRFIRVNGNVNCHICGEPYWKHPDEMRIVGPDDEPFVKRLCNGWLGKL